MTARLAPWVGRLPLLLVLITGLLVLHSFFAAIGRAPGLSFDDALAQISVNLSREGRLGFDAVPIQSLANVSQVDGFFNYGPWYFVLGGLLDWLVGTSYEVQRSLHPLGLLFVIGMASRYFAREPAGRGALAVFASLILVSFHSLHWPMVRPDIVGSMAVAGALVAAARLFAAGSTGAAFLLGIASGVAVTNHPVSAALVPWSLGVTWLGLRSTSTRGRRELMVGVGAWASGLLACVLVLIAASGFRPDAILRLYTSYPKAIAAAGQTSFFEAIARRLSMLGLPYGGEVAWVIALVLTVLADTALTAFLPAARPRAWLSLAPGWAFVLYVLSEGVFRNHHSGYEILTGVLFAWTVSGLAVRAAPIATLASLVVPALALGFVWRTPARFEEVAAASVPYQAYIDAVREGVPADAWVQGDAVFSIDRPSWVEPGYVTVLGRMFRPASRSRLSPDYLAMLDATWRLDCLHASAGFVRPELRSPGQPRFTHFGKENWILEQGSYHLESLVNASPYRTTRVYRRTSGDAPEPSSPGVAFWSATGGWSRTLGRARSPFIVDGNLAIRVPGGAVEAPISMKVDDALTARLPRGGYLLTIDGVPDESCVIASRSDVITGDAEIDGIAPVFPRANRTSMLIDHPGGALHLGVMSHVPLPNPPTVEVRRVIQGAPPTERDAYTDDLLRCARDRSAAGCDVPRRLR